MKAEQQVKKLAQTLFVLGILMIIPAIINNELSILPLTLLFWSVMSFILSYFMTPRYSKKGV